MRIIHSKAGELYRAISEKDAARGGKAERIGWSAGGKKLHITFDELHDLFFCGPCCKADRIGSQADDLPSPLDPALTGRSVLRKRKNRKALT